jgi:metallo-beta-lactamase class B
MQFALRILASLAVGILIQPALIGTTFAQPSQDELRLKILGYLQTWIEPTEPFKIVGPIYNVGTKGLAAYLVTPPDGHILLDGAVPGAAEDIEESIRKLGFRPKDIKLLLITHAHIDHAGTIAHFAKLSGATVAVMNRDFQNLNSGGKGDPVYGTKPPFYFPPVTAERVLRDEDTLSVGNIRITALLGAGDTQGATTWVTTVEALV